MKYYVPNQEEPYGLLQKRILLPKEKKRLNEYKKIVLNTHPNYDDKKIKEMFNDLKEHGCTFATYANVILQQLNFIDPDILTEKWKEIFGYSLYDEDGDYVDYNRLMVDLCSTMYEMGKLKATWNNEYAFETVGEAYRQLMQKDFNQMDENIMFKELFEIGYMPNGFDLNGRYLFKDVKHPNVVEVVGTYGELANKVFKKDFSNLREDQIKEIFNNNKIEIDESGYVLHSKLSGILPNDVMLWLRKFFELKNIDVEIDAENIPSDNEIEKLLESLIENGKTICVSTNSREVHMKCLEEKSLNWTKTTRHAMFLKEILKTGDLIISSWGKDYLIPHDFINLLEFRGVVLKPKQGYTFDNDEQKSISM